MMFNYYKDYKIQEMEDCWYIVDMNLYRASFMDVIEAVDIDIKEKAKMNDCVDCLPQIKTKVNPFKKKSLCELAPLQEVKCPEHWYTQSAPVSKEEGKTPMRYNDNYASANAVITSQKSDAAMQRDYLLNRLSEASYPKRTELQKLFNLFVDNTPQTYAQMVDIIKAGTYTIDPKVAKKVTAEDFNPEHYHCGFTHGIIWPGPVADWKGFTAAEADMEKQMNAARDQIMIGNATTGLTAIQAFEAWLPTVTASPAVAA